MIKNTCRSLLYIIYNVYYIYICLFAGARFPRYAWPWARNDPAKCTLWKSSTRKRWRAKRTHWITRSKFCGGNVHACVLAWTVLFCLLLVSSPPPPTVSFLIPRDKIVLHFKPNTLLYIIIWPNITAAIATADSRFVYIQRLISGRRIEVSRKYINFYCYG